MSISIDYINKESLSKERLSDQVQDDLKEKDLILQKDTETQEKLDRYIQKREHEQLYDLRKRNAKTVAGIAIAWITFIIIIMFFQAFKCCTFSLSENVILALIGSTTVNIIGLFYIVLRFIFPSK